MYAVLSISKEKKNFKRGTCLNKKLYIGKITCLVSLFNHVLVLPLKRKVICYKLELGKNLANVLTEHQQVFPDW